MVLTIKGILNILPALINITISIFTSVSNLDWYFTIISFYSSAYILPFNGEISHAAGNLS
jgi:hypothetical protein